MQASRDDNTFEMNLGESKPLSPLTYYHPFQSTFDPEFGSPPSSSSDQGVKPVFRWNKECEGRKVTGCGGRNPWTESGPRPRWCSSFNLGPRGQGVDAYAGSAGLTRSTGSESLSCWNQWQMNPVPLYPGVTAPKDQGQYVPIRVHNRPVPDIRHINLSTFGIPSAQVGLSCDPTMRKSTIPSLTNHQFKKESQDQPKQGVGHKRPMVCNFCKNNKEVPDIYMNHYLYDPKTKKLTCPVLRKHVCEICGETGDRAHTLQYCPINRQRGLQAKIPVLLKTRTITNSTGKIRRN